MTERAAALKALFDAGSSLADIAFAFSQRPRTSKRDAAMLSDASETWDLALTDLLDVIKRPRARKKAGR